MPQRSPLPHEAFRADLATLGWSGSAFARRTGVAPNTVHRWARGELPLPKWVPEYLRALLAVKALARELGLSD